MHSPAALTFVALSCLSCSVMAQDCSNGFKSGSEQFTTVGFKSQNRRGRITTDVQEAEVTWKPQEMLDDLSCYDLGETVLLYKTAGEDEWKVSDAIQRPSGASAKWLVPVVPCLPYNFAIKVQGQDEAIFELPQTVGPADPKEITKSGYIPEAPQAFSANVMANMARLNWVESACASNYEISFAEVGSDEYRYETPETASIDLGELQPCTNYEITLNAVLGEEFSDDTIANFATKPRLDAANDLEVSVKSTINSAVVSWDAWKSVSCITQYQLTICSVSSADEDCLPTVMVDKLPGLPTVTYTADGLDPCTDYNLQIQPMYPEAEVESKMVSFRTLSPSASESQVGQIKVEPVSSGSMLLQWPTVKCAANYLVYQQETDSEDWKQVADTAETRITIDNITPCTELRFAVSALLDGQETDRSIGESVMSDLEEADPFEAPNLVVQNADKSAELTWDHADCIESYVVKVCQPSYTDCNTYDLDPVSGDKVVTHLIEDLEPCTQYSLEVVPIITGKVFTARQKDFTTTNGTPQAPQTFKAVLTKSTAQLDWEPVQCSTGYKVYNKVGDPQAYEIATPSNGLSESFESLIPCETYYYSVATMVDEQESERTPWQSLLVEPNAAAPPSIKIVSNENDNVTLTLGPDDMNAKCKSAQVELSYSATGAEPYQMKLVEADKVNSGSDIVLSFPGASGPNFIVQARIKYEGTETWSEIATSREPGDLSRIHQVPSEDTATLIPIVVGVVVALLLIILIIVFVVRKRKARDNYDAEKAGENGKQEETQKLNENHPDA